MATTSCRRITLLLERGHSVPSVAKALRCTRRWVYDHAKRRGLPRNLPIRPGSDLEQKIALALLQYKGDIPLIARLFSQAEPNIRALIKRVSSPSHSRVS